ncbi:MAG: hypothetical protein UT00_C0027G0007 [Parcubacteria group bacterium GW2011_GWA1_38_7]|nr:MAG: hypothetical protein UT00_C0027G0007 [Parcubacteria group bacterium GW2011_GWA1_38_7]
MTLKERKKVLNYLILIVVVSIALSLLGTKLDTVLIREFVSKTGYLSPFIFILLLSLCQIIAPVSGTPIYLAGYVLFERNVLFYNYASYLIAAFINFSIARKWGRNWVIRLVGKDDMSKIDTFAKGYGIKSLLFLRIFQSHLSDFISYAFGLTKINFIKYIIISILAPIPMLIVWYIFIFKTIDNLNDFSLWFLITLIPLFVISWYYWKYLKKNNEKSKKFKNRYCL